MDDIISPSFAGKQPENRLLSSGSEPTGAFPYAVREGRLVTFCDVGAVTQ
jgi:hypothetical protein